MITRVEPRPSAPAARDGLVAGLALAAAAWAGVAGAPVPILGGLVTLALVAIGSHPRVGRDARIVAWIGAGITVPLAIHLPPVWPLVQLAFLLPVAVAIACVRDLRGARRWLSRGTFDPLPVALMGGLSVVALLAWVAWLDPDLTRAAAFIPQLPLPLLLLGLAGFSVVNAILEELVFRGLLQGALESLLGPGRLALLLPAALFGLCHYHGIPSGPAGAVMAGSWAVLLGWARRRTHGLLTPVLAHIAADAAIFAILLRAR